MGEIIKNYLGENLVFALFIRSLSLTGSEDTQKSLVDSRFNLTDGGLHILAQRIGEPPENVAGQYEMFKIRLFEKLTAEKLKEIITE